MDHKLLNCHGLCCVSTVRHSKYVVRFTLCDVRYRSLVWPFVSEAQRTVRRAAQRPAFCLLQAATGGNGRQRKQRGECSAKSSEQSTDGNATQRKRKRSNSTQSNGSDKRWRMATVRHGASPRLAPTDGNMRRRAATCTISNATHSRAKHLGAEQKKRVRKR